MGEEIAVVGAWRSLVARFVRDEEVAGSNPVAPTTYFPAKALSLGLFPSPDPRSLYPLETGEIR